LDLRTTVEWSEIGQHFGRHCLRPDDEQFRREQVVINLSHNRADKANALLNHDRPSRNARRDYGYLLK